MAQLMTLTMQGHLTKLVLNCPFLLYIAQTLRDNQFWTGGSNWRPRENFQLWNEIDKKILTLETAKVAFRTKNNKIKKKKQEKGGEKWNPKNKQERKDMDRDQIKKNRKTGNMKKMKKRPPPIIGEN